MEIRKNFLHWTAAAAALLLLPPSLAAQQQSAIIRGLVAGADGRPVADATVSLLDHLGSPVAVTRTEFTGRFRLDDVPPGTYTLLAEAPPQQSDARVVTVRAALPVDVELTLTARLSESVIVQGTSEAPPVTTRMTIAGEALRQLPTRLPSRGVQQLLATLPGWASEDNGLLHVRGVDDGFLYVEDGVPVYDPDGVWNLFKTHGIGAVVWDWSSLSHVLPNLKTFKWADIPVGDKGMHTVAVFDKDGRFIVTFGQYPRSGGVYIDGMLIDEHVVVISKFNRVNLP